MDNAPIAGNRSIDRKIKECFALITPEDADKIRRKFAELPRLDDTQDERLHLFRELILGAYLTTLGRRVRYARLLDGLTPDWSLLDQSGELEGIVEVFTFHPGAQPVSDRLYGKAEEKFLAYRELAARHEIPFVVGIHVDFTHDVDESDIRDCLYNEEYGLLVRFPEASGALFSVIDVNRYPIEYYPSPHARWPIEIPNGII
jgi:hypothetical protein